MSRVPWLIYALVWLGLGVFYAMTGHPGIAAVDGVIAFLNYLTAFAVRT